MNEEEKEIRIDLTTRLRTCWSAGNQIEALKFYLGNVEFLWDWQEKDYQGNCYAIFRMQIFNYNIRKLEWIYVIWRDSFGSCSGCDGLDGCNLESGREYIENTLQEGNTKQFKSLDEMQNWLIITEDYFWNYNKETLLRGILEIKKKKEGI